MGKAYDIMHHRKEYIIKEYLSGRSATSIATEIGVSFPSVIRFLKSDCGIIPKQRFAFDSFDKYKDQVLEMYNKNMTCGQMAKELGCCRYTVISYIHKLGLDSSRFSTQRDDPLKNHTDEIIEMYQSGVGSDIISQKFNAHHKNVLDLLRKNNIKIRGLRKYKLNERFFEKIDTWAKSYSIGLLAADGCLAKNNHVVVLNVTDRELPEYLKMVTESESPLSIIIPTVKTNKPLHSCRLCSKQMCLDLINNGCGHNKTFTLQFPTKDIIPRDLLPGYLLGFTDGDGHLGIQKNCALVSFAGCKAMMYGIHNFCATMDIKSHICPHKGGHPDIYRLRFSSINALKFCNYIYQNHEFCLQRKFLVYQRMKELYENLNTRCWSVNKY